MESGVSTPTTLKSFELAPNQDEDTKWDTATALTQQQSSPQQQLTPQSQSQLVVQSPQLPQSSPLKISSPITVMKKESRIPLVSNPPMRIAKSLDDPKSSNLTKVRKSLAMPKSSDSVKFRPVLGAKGAERLAREYRDIKVSGMRQVRELRLSEGNLYHWKFLLLPEMAPFHKAAFHADIKFPETYPEQPPMITVQNIYHPNIDQKGFVCLHCLAHWVKTMKIEDVLNKLFALIRDPEPHHPMRFDVADEFLKDRQSYLRKAAEAAKLQGVQRPRY